VAVSQQQEQVDLLLGFLETRDMLQGTFRYNPDLFDVDTVEQLEQHLRRLLTEITVHPDRRLSSWPFFDRLRPMAKRQKAAGPGDSAGDPLNPSQAPDQKTEPAPVAAPRTPVEETLVQIWGDVLGKERIGRHTNFFENGGHSLLAAQIVARVPQVLAVELPLSSLFEAPTVAQLAAHVEAAQRAEQTEPLPAIRSVPRDGALPLSFSQERMWFMHQWQPQSSAYNVSLAIRLTGVLAVDVLEQSFHELERRHETLHTVIATVEERPLQTIIPATAPELPLLDLTGLPPGKREAEAQVLIDEEACRPFDLSRGPLWRTILFRLGREEHILLLTMHHIICDAWSLGVVMRELAAIYDAFVAGNASPLPQPSLQYADFAYWQRQRLQGEAMALQLAYWRQQLADVPVLSLPTDRPRPAVQTYEGKVQSLVPEADLFSALNWLSQKENVSLFMTLLAAFQVLLYRYTGQTDIAVGVPVANRHWRASEELIGTLVNTLVLRVDLDGDLTFRRLLQRVREVALAAYAHQDLPFARLVAELRPQRDTSYSPLFQVMFDYTNIPVPAIELSRLSWNPVEVDRGAAQFDLTLAVTNTEQIRRLGFEYNTDLFDDGTIKRMLAHLQTLLAGLVADPDTPIARLPLLTDAERHQLLLKWNRTQMDYPQDLGLHQLFEAQVERTPNKVAVVLAGECLTYRELNRRANRLGRYLRALGVGAETLVGIGVERSLEMVVALLGVLKAGGAYVPLDPGFPQRRLSAMVADAQVKVLLTQQNLEHLFQGTARGLVYLDRS
jgi:acyl carrier protein